MQPQLKHRDNPLFSKTKCATVEAIENDLEFKAYVYQQLVELQPYLSADAQVSVLVQSADREGKEQTDQLSMTLITTVGDYRLEAGAQSANVYEAFAEAKKKMIVQLDEWMNLSIDPSERDAEIESLIAGGNILH